MHFLNDFKYGRDKYCSPLLVNVILALACRFSDLPEGRADSLDSDTAGNTFFQEAEALLANQTESSLLTTQALSLMSLREAGCGHDSISRFYACRSIWMAVELGLHMDYAVLDDEVFSNEEREVRSITFWGCFTLDQ